MLILSDFMMKVSGHDTENLISKTHSNHHEKNLCWIHLSVCMELGHFCASELDWCRTQQKMAIMYRRKTRQNARVCHYISFVNLLTHWNYADRIFFIISNSQKSCGEKTRRIHMSASISFLQGFWIMEIMLILCFKKRGNHAGKTRGIYFSVPM